MPQFDQLDITELATQTRHQIAAGHALLQRLAQDGILGSFDAALNVLRELDDIELALSESYGLLGHLNGVMNTPQLREIYQGVLTEVSALYTALGQSEGLFGCYQQVANAAEFASLRPAWQSAIEHALKDFELSGVALPADKKAQFAANASELSQLGMTFSHHVMDATQAFVLPVSEAELQGLPDSSRALLQQYGQQHGLDGAAVTLDFPAYHAVMAHAERRKLREQIYRAYTTRASEFGPAELDNSTVMQRILELRQQQAALLGFANYAELSLARKMAPDVATVEHFLLDLVQQARAPAQAELADMQVLADADGIGSLQSWDTAFYAEKLKQQRFDLSQDALKPYFPVDQVINGLFDICQRLFGIAVVRKQAPVWHPDVRYFEIEQDGEVLGGFYFDLYARAQKNGGAWMRGYRSHMQDERHQQRPIAFMVANFTPPVAGQPAQLSHDEIVTLFHEFGHGLHHVLTEADHIGVAGTHAVAWDAVELPSQFLEFWAWQDEALALISGHVDTGQSLPPALLQSLLAARTFQSGLQIARQIEFALFDLRLHQQNPAPDAVQIEQLLQATRQQVALLAAPAYNRFAHAFSHIFSGGYAAGYYSYKWAEVLASDAFDRFEQEGVFNAQTGLAFRQSILAVGGQVDALTAFRNFRGREPRHDALLRHNGWTTTGHQQTQHNMGSPS